MLKKTSKLIYSENCGFCATNLTWKKVKCQGHDIMAFPSSTCKKDCANLYHMPPPVLEKIMNRFMLSKFDLGDGHDGVPMKRTCRENQTC